MQSLRASRFWPWIRDGALALVLLAGVRAYQQRNVPSGHAPALVGTALDGSQVSLAAFRGNPVVVHFWATWCGVCKAEQSNIDALARDVAVVTVATQSGSAEQIAAYVSAHGVTPTVIADTSGALAKRFGVGAFPTTFVLDGDGDIRHVEVGYTTELGLRVRTWLARL